MRGIDWRRLWANVLAVCAAVLTIGAIIPVWTRHVVVGVPLNDLVLALAANLAGLCQPSIMRRRR